MNKRGFTLIELLAVIVILAIIALIAVPIVLNMIENARKSAAKSSAYGYIEAIDNYNELAEMNGEIEGVPTTPIENGEHQVSEITINIKGKKPSSGKVVLTKGRVSSATDLCFNDYPVSYDGTEATVGTKGCSSGSTPEPVYNWDSYMIIGIGGTTNVINEGEEEYIRIDSSKNYAEVCSYNDPEPFCISGDSNGRQSDFANASSGVVTGYTEEKRQEFLSKYENSYCEVSNNRMLCIYRPLYDYFERFCILTSDGNVLCGNGHDPGSDHEYTNRECHIWNNSMECEGMY